jgi:hypothetical protein
MMGTKNKKNNLMMSDYKQHSRVILFLLFLFVNLQNTNLQGLKNIKNMQNAIHNHEFEYLHNKKLKLNQTLDFEKAKKEKEIFFNLSKNIGNFNTNSYNKFYLSDYDIFENQNLKKIYPGHFTENKTTQTLMIDVYVFNKTTEITFGLDSIGSNEQIKNKVVQNKILLKRIAFKENLKQLDKMVSKADFTNSSNEKVEFPFLQFILPQLIKKLDIRVNIKNKVNLKIIDMNKHKEILDLKLKLDNLTGDENETTLNKNLNLNLSTLNKTKDMMMKDQFLSSNPKFKFGNSYFKFKSVEENKVNISNNNLLKKPKHSQKNILAQLSNSTKVLENPCYQKGYFNQTSNMKGTGNFPKCYELLSLIIRPGESINLDIQSSQSSQKNNNLKSTSYQSILLGSEFKDISDYFRVDNITLSKVKLEAEKICSQNYSNNNTLSSSNLCMKLTYTIILIQKLFNVNLKNAEYTILLFSSNLKISLNENDLLINHSFFQSEEIPLQLLISFILLLLLFLSSYLFKPNLNTLFQNLFFTEKLDKDQSKLNLILLETTITSLPVQNYIFKNLLDEIKIFTQSEVFISLAEYKIFFFKMFKKYPGLRNKVYETINKRNNLKSSIVICILQILLAVILSIFTTKIISYLNIENQNYLRILLVVSSFIYMSVLILECLKLITFIDNMKYLYSNNLTNYDKKFLEEEYENYELNNNISIESQN